MQIGDLINAVCEALPPGWHIQIEIGKDEGSFSLFDPDWELVDYCDDDLTYEERVMERVDLARVCSDMKPHFDSTYVDPGA